MKSFATHFTIAAVYLIFWAVLGFWILPNYQQIFADYLGGPNLPWVTVQVLRQGPTGCVLIGILGSTFIVGIASAKPTQMVQRRVLMAACAPIIWVSAVLVWPLRFL